MVDVGEIGLHALYHPCVTQGTRFKASGALLRMILACQYAGSTTAVSWGKILPEPRRRGTNDEAFLLFPPYRVDSLNPTRSDKRALHSTVPSR